MVQLKVRVQGRNFFSGRVLWEDDLYVWWAPGTKTVNMRFRFEWGSNSWGEVFSEKISDMGEGVKSVQEFLNERFFVVA